MPKATKPATKKQTSRRAATSKSIGVSHAAVQQQLARVGLSSSAMATAVRGNVDADVIRKAQTMAATFADAAQLIHRSRRTACPVSAAEQGAKCRQAEDARVAFVATVARTEAGARAKLEAILSTTDNVTINAALISAIRDAIAQLQ